MKTKLKIAASISCAALALFASGCASSQINAVMSNLKGDPNVVHASFVSSFGTIEIDRSGPITSTNGYTIGGAAGINAQ